MNTDNTAAQHTKVVIPLATIGVVALAIAKWGFHMAIPLLWVFAPYWMPIALAFGVLLGIGALIAIVFIGLGIVYCAISLTDMVLRRQRERQARERLAGIARAVNGASSIRARP